MTNGITVTDMVERLGVTRGRIENAIAKLDVEPEGWVGNVRVYQPSLLLKVRDQLIETSPPPDEVV